MRAFLSEDHRLHFPRGELHGGEFVTPFERPSRVEHVLRRLRDRGFPAVEDPGPCDVAALARVHDAGYLEFLETAWEAWTAAGFAGELIPTIWPARRMPGRRVPRNIEGRAGWYALAAETAITGGTWRAALSSAASARAAARAVVDGERAAFALCRPPGHHAAIDLYGGYCFLNNAALAVDALLAAGRTRVAVLDVDFHHGNGTQDIFYDRGDVAFVSLHGHPEDAFPHFAGHADETGTGAGEGATLNLPMRPGTGYAEWSDALERGLARVGEFDAEALVVSLGVDAFEHDPISFFELSSDDFADCGARIAAAGLPTVFVMEGGYAIEAVGVNAVNVLEGFGR